MCSLENFEKFENQIHDELQNRCDKIRNNIPDIVDKMIGLTIEEIIDFDLDSVVERVFKYKVEQTKMLFVRQHYKKGGVFSTQCIISAAKKGYSGILRALLFYREDDVSLEDLDTAFIFACENGHIRAAKALISHKCNIHFLNDYAIVAACKSNYVTMAMFLLKIGVSASAQYSRALIEAIENDNVIMVSLLLDYGADVNGSLKHNTTNPILLAIERRHMTIIKILLRRGADVHVQNNEPFKRAKLKKDDEILKLLREYK